MLRELEERCRTLPVRFTGYISDEEYLQLLNACDLVVIPSRNEPFGLVLTEAWSAERCVVATDVGGLSENIDNFIDGIKVPVRADSLAWGISYIIEDRVRIRAMGLAGKRKVLFRFNWKDIGRMMEKVYATMLTGRGEETTAEGGVSRAMTTPVAEEEHPFLSDYDIFLFRQGRHYRLYRKMGSHPFVVDGTSGTWFSVWAPNARQVTVIGDFNGWDPSCHPLHERPDESGIWEGFIDGAQTGMRYRYHIVSRYDKFTADRGDPLAFSWEVPPATASVIAQPGYAWQDSAWMEREEGSRRPDRAPLNL